MMKKCANYLVGILGLVLMAASPVASAYRNTGTTTVKQTWDSKYTDNQATAYYWTGNRTGLGDTSKWKWVWAKYYPEFTFYCSNPGQTCPGSAAFSRSEAIATMIGVSFSGAGTDKVLTANLTASFQKTFTTTTTYTFTAGANVPHGKNAYAGVITLTRAIKDARMMGRWDAVAGTCKTTTSLGGSYRTCTFRWDNDVQAGTWSGTQNTNNRTLICATSTTVSPRNGDSVPSGCSLPALPSGWYGG
jgi:hypothetical protein